jgi:hypothetical protein
MFIRFTSYATTTAHQNPVSGKCLYVLNTSFQILHTPNHGGEFYGAVATTSTTTAADADKPLIRCSRK